ncbi:3'-5' exonuclease [Malikia sp.]|uniref:3'-5' exonuclease n=1 Tax=Malikia sp. TaxID=2070706 RepID=UPI0026129F89|nr:3'-5' exonuclease [Malikia sp.]MDD2728654.1 3'-5' exonuclease [Malikia sp.]
MEHPLLPSRLAGALRREWRLRHLGDASYGFLFDPAPENEWVSLACATTGHDQEKDRVLALCAVRVRGHRVLSSERLELLLRPDGPDGRVATEALRRHGLREQDLAQDLPAAEAAKALLHFIGSRPLLGYYLEFDCAMLEQIVKPLIGIGLPQEQLEVSSLYYDWRLRQLPPYQQDGVNIDLRYSTMLQALDLPERESPDPLDRAVLTALAFIKLRQMAAV